MSITDNPLKILITNTIESFASWLLDRPVSNVHPLNVEFPGQDVRSDLLFLVADPPRTILHLELQGRSTHRPMPLRQLEYISRIVDREIRTPSDKNNTRLHSVVFYLGKGAGATDTGTYQVRGLDNSITLNWRYTVIRLWNKSPAWLHELGHPALLALAGQTQLTQPKEELVATLTQIRQIEDETLRQHVIGAFASLLPSKEVLAMIEMYLESDESWVLELPYLQRIREKAQQSGWTEGRTKGQAEGKIQALSKAILDGTVERFNPPVRDYQQLSKQLKHLADADVLQALLIKLFSIDSMDAFLVQVEQQLSSS